MALALLIGRQLTGPAKASLFALAGASLMALQSALYKATITALERDKLGVFTHWQAYALIVASFLGLYLVQNAYQAGPLAASMAVMDAVLPTVAIALGIGLFGEPINTSWWGLTGASAGLALLIGGVVALDTSGAVRPSTARREEPKAGLPRGWIGGNRQRRLSTAARKGIMMTRHSATPAGTAPPRSC